jgi:hypothetical protein
MKKIKTYETHGLDFVYRWSTHVPVINTSLEILNPELVVELGIGHFSSPLFFKSNIKKILHIENDENWLSMVKEKHKDKIKNNSEFRHHNIGDIDLSTRLKDISQTQKKEIEKYYTELSIEIKSMTYKSALMFTDGFTCARRLSIDILTNDFQIVIYHDAEDRETYDYNNIKKDLYKTYDNYVLKTTRTYTGFFMKKGLIEQIKLHSIMDKHIHNYIKELNITREGFELIKI